MDTCACLLQEFKVSIKDLALTDFNFQHFNRFILQIKINKELEQLHFWCCANKPSTPQNLTPLSFYPN